MAGEVLEKVKISELPAATNFEGLVTIGTDGSNRSVKVPVLGLTKPPIIGSDGYWYVFSLANGSYARTSNVAVGKSAYQQAQEAGYTGTEAQFMTALARIGDPNALTTTDKTTLVAAINELVAKGGDLSALSTTAKSNLVAAINELTAGLGDVRNRTASLENRATALEEKFVFLTEEQFEAMTNLEPGKIYCTYES